MLCRAPNAQTRSTTLQRQELAAESRGAWGPGKRRADNMRRPGAIPRASASDSPQAAFLAPRTIPPIF
jgi:hypothetical protein